MCQEKLNQFETSYIFPTHPILDRADPRRNINADFISFSKGCEKWLCFFPVSASFISFWITT